MRKLLIVLSVSLSALCLVCPYEAPTEQTIVCVDKGKIDCLADKVHGPFRNYPHGDKSPDYCGIKSAKDAKDFCQIKCKRDVKDTKIFECPKGHKKPIPTCPKRKKSAAR